jgi:hypothetical protein
MPSRRMGTDESGYEGNLPQYSKIFSTSSGRIPPILGGAVHGIFGRLIADASDKLFKRMKIRLPERADKPYARVKEPPYRNLFDERASVADFFFVR